MRFLEIIKFFLLRSEIHQDKKFFMNYLNKFHLSYFHVTLIWAKKIKILFRFLYFVQLTAKYKSIYTRKKYSSSFFTFDISIRDSISYKYPEYFYTELNNHSAQEIYLTNHRRKRHK